MELIYLNFLKENIDKIGGEIISCSPTEIEKFQSDNKIKLPLAYVEFLLLMGHRSGDFFSDCDMEFKYLNELQREANQILERNKVETLLLNDFVFLVHQNYSFRFFKLYDSDDPTVYSFVEGDDVSLIQPEYSKFSDSIRSELNNYLKATSQKWKE